MKEALQHEDLQIPSVLGTGQPSSSACLYMEDLSPTSGRKYIADLTPNKSRDTEDMRCGKNNNESRIQLLSYHLHLSRLDAFYDRILEKIALPGHYMFRDPILLHGQRPEGPIPRSVLDRHVRSVFTFLGRH